MADPARFPLQKHHALLLKNPLQHPLKFLYIQCPFTLPNCYVNSVTGFILN